VCRYCPRAPITHPARRVDFIACVSCTDMRACSQVCAAGVHRGVVQPHAMPQPEGLLVCCEVRRALRPQPHPSVVGPPPPPCRARSLLLRDCLPIPPRSACVVADPPVRRWTSCVSAGTGSAASVCWRPTRRAAVRSALPTAAGLTRRSHAPLRGAPRYCFAVAHAYCFAVAHAYCFAVAHAYCFAVAHAYCFAIAHAFALQLRMLIALQLRMLNPPFPRSPARCSPYCFAVAHAYCCAIAHAFCFAVAHAYCFAIAHAFCFAIAHAYCFAIAHAYCFAIAHACPQPTCVFTEPSNRRGCWRACDVCVPCAVTCVGSPLLPVRRSRPASRQCQPATR
jgi:hypothetical protein